MDASQEVPCGLFVTRGDGSKLLDDVEKALDEVAFAVEREVASTLCLAVCFWRYHGGYFTNFQALHESIAVVALIGDQRLRLDLSGECLGLGDIVRVGFEIQASRAIRRTSSITAAA
jgi:hypothetical protein